MSHLLDVNTLIALIWSTHADHERAQRWRAGKTLVLCPITELGFVRVSTSPAFNATMTDARTALQAFIDDELPGFIAANTRALEGSPAPNSKTTTDYYLANLASTHGLKLATFDEGIAHPAVETIG